MFDTVSFRGILVDTNDDPVFELLVFEDGTAVWTEVSISDAWEIFVISQHHGELVSRKPLSDRERNTFRYVIDVANELEA